MPLALLALLLLSCSTAQSSNPVSSTASAGETHTIHVAEATPASPAIEASSASLPERKKEAVLVELFTSQGCSSCPPADELLRGIDAKTDIDVIALSFHVDYWDYIGWRDPYSSRQATQRQQAYAAKISQGRAYTPQLVVDGRAHVLGSSAKDAVAAIERASKRARSGLSLSTRLARKQSGQLEVELKATGPLRGKRLYLAVYESGLTTKVVRGENAGRKIRNDYVVRHLTPVSTGMTQLALDASWDAGKLGIVAFAQDKKTLRIEAVHRNAL